MESYTFSKTKRIAAQNILTLLAKATIKVVANDTMCDFYFQSKDSSLSSLMSFFVYRSFTLGYSCSFRKASPMINFEETLNHPLSNAPLTLFNADGSVCMASKNKLAAILMSNSNEEKTCTSKENTSNVVDLMALMRVVAAIPEKFEDFAFKLRAIFPN